MSARLHREPIAAAGKSPDRWLVATHGIYGSGGNWRSIARQVVERRPEWGVLLVDLRGHGRSDDGDPPHDLSACAGDLLALVAEEAAAGRAVRGLCGHSFGGKVVLATRAVWPDAALLQTWALDSTPSARPEQMTAPGNTVLEVLALLETLPPRWARRADFVRAVSGTPDGSTLANWLAMSLVPDGDELRLRLDVGMMRQLLADYYARDLWPAVEDARLPGEVRLVVAARSDTVSADDRARAEASGILHLVDAGHWLHLEAPAAVVAVLAEHLA